MVLAVLGAVLVPALAVTLTSSTDDSPGDPSFLLVQDADPQEAMPQLLSAAPSAAKQTVSLLTKASEDVVLAAGSPTVWSGPTYGSNFVRNLSASVRSAVAIPSEDPGEEAPAVDDTTPEPLEAAAAGSVAVISDLTPEPPAPAPTQAAPAPTQPPPPPAPTEPAPPVRGTEEPPAPTPTEPPPPPPPPTNQIHGVRLTWYDCATEGFCGNTASGHPVGDGVAACSYDLPFYTQFYIVGDPTGRVYTCLDRGNLSNTWVDVWFYHAADGIAWQSVLGQYVTIVIIS